MSLATQINFVFNSTLDAVHSVIPSSLSVGEPNQVTEPLSNTLGVHIGFTGDINGQLMILGNNDVFGSIGEVMFGFQLSGEMLESFTGELGNMVAGNFSTNISKSGITIDITTPTVLNEPQNSIDQSKYVIPVFIENKGVLHILLSMEDSIK